MTEHPVPRPSGRDGASTGVAWHIVPENDYAELLPVEPGAADLPVTVVIPAYNRVELLRRTLAGVAAQTYPAGRLSVVVADDGSEEDVPGGIADLADKLSLQVLRRDHEGYGAGRARNLGAAEATGDVLVFVDADCIPDQELVARHVAWHAAAANLVVIGSRQHIDTSDLDVARILDGSAELRRRAFGRRTLPGEELVPDDWRRLLYRRTTRLRYGNEAFRALVSSNFSVRRERFLESGGFDEDFTRWGGEDTELGWRLFQAGLIIAPEDRAIIYHQTQEDEGPDPQWRERARRLNDGIIATKIPHRFYRTSRRWWIYEVPKVSVVLAPTVGARVQEVFDRLLEQTLTDWELIAASSSEDDLAVLADETRADPRLRIISPADDRDPVRSAIEAARGEYVALLHGAASPERRLLARAVKPLEDGPRLSACSVGYLTLLDDGEERHLRGEDASWIDQQWSGDNLAVFHLARRREWAKALRVEDSVASAHARVRALSGSTHVADALVALPGPTPDEAVDADVPMAFSDRTLLSRDRKRARSPVHVARLAVRFAVNRVRSRPYRALRPAEQPPSPATADPADRGPSPQRPIRTRYVGWIGHDNLGDEAMLYATRSLLPWADIATKGPAKELLLLGGGTLINRGYLKQLEEHDSPRIERAVFGTGVANPEYWGEPREDPRRWVNFLSTCAYVGVRGPISAEILRSWGYTGPLEVIGDPALALRPPDDAPPRRDDHVVVNVANTRGLLWGLDDDAVYEAMAHLIKSLTADGLEVSVLSCAPIDDHPSYELIRAAGVPNTRYVAGYRSMEDALGLLASARYVVGERLHSLVLAAACETPFIGIEYRPKVRDFARSVGMDRFVVRSDHVGDGALRNLLDEMDLRWDDTSRAVSDALTDYTGRLAHRASALREVTA